MPKKMSPKQQYVLDLAKGIHEKSKTGVCKKAVYGKTFAQSMKEASVQAKLRRPDLYQDTPKRKTTTKKK